ncbi:MAG: hypothetical protein ACM3II_13225, partial [Rhodospirillaceae bacterium]
MRFSDRRRGDRLLGRRFGFLDGLGGRRLLVMHRLDGLHEARRSEHGRSRLGRLRLLRGGGGLLAALCRRGVRMLREHVAAGQGDATLTRDAFDERTRHDLFDRARGALQLDAVVPLQQRKDFLARRVEQLRDLVNPDRCQIESSAYSWVVPA